MKASQRSLLAVPNSGNEAPRKRVTDIQRARLLTAASDALEEIGYQRMTVAEIVGRAGVSRKTFYEAFADREDCFLALLDETITQAATLVEGAYREARDWRLGMRSVLGGLLVLMDSEPALARLWLLESVKGGERVLARRTQVLERLAELVNEGSAAAKSGRKTPDVVAVALVGGILEILHRRLLERSSEPLTELLGPLMYMIVLLYHGERAARSELSKPVPQAARPKASATSAYEQLDGLKMRMTYRTLLVLGAIDQRSGASNREVASAAGIADQGQISKLLTRLVRLGLIENFAPQQNGAPNAWRLTQRGEQLIRKTTTHRYASQLRAAGAFARGS